MSERVLHICLRTPFEQQPALAAALRSIATSHYAELDWQSFKDRSARVPALLERARGIKPTIVFMQLQCEGVFTPRDIELLRERCNPAAVIVSWDGDLRHEPGHPDRRWFSELGKALDISLITNTGQLEGYRALGIRCEYLQIGIDETIYKPSPPTPGTPEVVMLASRYSTHVRRNKLVEALAKRYGKRFGVYGSGWEKYPCGNRMLRQTEEAGVYSAARCAISMSIRNDLAHYSSDRLFRAMACGAVVLVEEFPSFQEFDTEASHLETFSWKTTPDLFHEIDFILNGEAPGERWRELLSQHARVNHSWAARMPELQRFVADVRATR